MNSPWNRSAFLRVALALFLALGLSLSARAQLKVGAARVEVTPPLYPGWQGPTGKFANEHLYVRAIVMDNGKTRAVLIGADQSDLYDDVWASASPRIAKDLGIPTDQILMSATHIHSPGMPIGRVPATFLDPNNKRVADAMVKAVEEAKNNEQPAQMVFGKGKVYLNSNRDAINPITHKWTQAPNLNAPSDKTLAVLAFETPEGKPFAIYVNYAMHPINGYLANFTSGDFPGAMSHYLEDDYGRDAVAIFSQGASGDQNPLYLHLATDGMASRSGVTITGNDLPREAVEAPLREGKVPGQPMDPAVRERLQNWMNVEGQLIGEEAIRVITHATPVKDDVRIWGKQVTATCPGRKRINIVPGSPREGVAGTYVDGPPVPLMLGVIGIGNVALTHIDAEIYTMIGERLKRQSPMANTFIVTLANGRAPSGYIPDDASYGHESFQVLGARIKEGCAEDTIDNTLTGLIDQYDAKQP